ncbi:NAD-dependent epimerase/dehydratase family protein [Flavisphingomonas formosensis]|uniref:NAD-dependent epimerase/dehydratase family protein n=1 Tax=Flavisphingomonas formosensis TaxID=861534 RepID=UPI0012F74FD7|nr:NAD-dependent epimerase/dehydratase family protein [Sphingomonas formosensis]
MHVLVTGSAGFIGFHLARRLLDDGHSVTGFDGMTSYYDVALKQDRLALLERSADFRFVQGMLEDRAALAGAARLREPEVIVHLGAQAGVRYSIEAPQTYIESNLMGSWSVLELAREIAPRHLLMASTSSVYGANAHIPFGECDRADEPLSLYAATKKGMEAMAHSYAHLFAIPSTMFRFFTVYGPWGRPDMALFKFVDAISAGRPIDVYGHGRMARDFTFIGDLIESIVRLIGIVPDEANRQTAVADTLSRNAPYRVVNIAGGHPTPLMDFIAAIEACLGRKAALNMMEMQPGDVPRTFADPALLKALTGYVPGTPVTAGVRAFVDWYRDYRRERVAMPLSIPA